MSLNHPRFPRSSAYPDAWVLANGCGSNPLWLAEWLAEAVDLRPGLRVLDLGCGRAASSIFLAREFGVQVWAVDLWFAPTENLRRVADAGLEDRVFPIHADAHALPFAGAFFDVVLSHDAFSYFGTNDLYLNYLAHFLKPGGQIGLAQAGLVTELDAGVPEHLQAMWTQDLWGMHSAVWWRRHWERTGIVEIERAETLPEGWRHWLAWHQALGLQGTPEMEALERDQGRTLGYVRVVGRRRPDVTLEDYCWPDTLRTMPTPWKPEMLLPPDFPRTRA